METPENPQTESKVVDKPVQIQPNSDGKGMNISIPIEVLQKKRLFIGTPMYGGQCTGIFSKSVADLSAQCANLKIPMQMYFLFNESLIPRARNYICDEFMRSGATHLMFIDADIGFNPADVLALLGLQSDESEYDVICGPYPKKCISWEKIALAVNKGMADNNPGELEKFVGDYVFNPKSGTTEIPIGLPCEVLEAGTGFMMIRRRTMEKFAAAFPQFLYKPDHVRTEVFDGHREIVQYFQAEIDITSLQKPYKEKLEQALSMIQENKSPVEIQKVLEEALKLKPSGSKRYLSEDYWFCQRLQDIGLRNWLCPWIQLQHVGSYVFSGSLAALASIGASATADPNAIKGKK